MRRLEPHECELCDCVKHRSDGRSAVLQTDPPATCVCGHLTVRHRYRYVKEQTDA